MRSCTWILAILLLVIPLTSALAEDDQNTWRHNSEEPGEWTVPTCERIIGTNTVTFTTDEGLTLAETQRPTRSFYTYGLAALEVGNTLLSSNINSRGASILRSEDAGCHWSQVTLLSPGDLLLLTAAPGDTAYAWTRGRDRFYRIEGNDVVTLSTPQYIYGLGVDPRDAAHIRVGAYDCQLYESFDGGASFAPLGGPANSGATIFFTVEFDPVDFDHALCGAKGAYRTVDAGRSWTTIPPFDIADIDLVYLFEFSPADPNRVWARANLETMANPSREILVSSDRGATFVPAIRQGDQVYDQNGIARTVILTNQPTMAAYPGDADVLYFAWGTYFQSEGTDLYRYDAALDAYRVVHIDGLDSIDAMAFNPAAPEVMYLGLEAENVSLTEE